MSSQRKGRVKSPQSINIVVFDMHGCSTNEVKKGEIGKMFLKRRFDVCALIETKGGDTLHSESCYLTNFRVRIPEHGTYIAILHRVNSRRQFCCSMHRGRVLVCRAAP